MFVIEEKVLLIFFLKAAQVLLKIKVSVEPCLVSVVVLMRGCSGTGAYEAGKEKNKKSQYTHYNKLVLSGSSFFSGTQRRRSHFSLPVLALIFPACSCLVSSIERLSLHGSPN